MKQLLCLLLLSAFWLPLSALAEAVPPPVPAIAVRMVHPDNQELAGKGKPAPEGYTACVHEFRGNDGEMKRTRLFVKDTPVITEADVERAQADPGSPGQINITLNTRGGRAMKETTSAMVLGHDRLAVLVHGRVTTAPVVMAILSNTFTVSGLDGKMKLKTWLNCSTARLPPERRLPSLPVIWPCTPFIRTAAGW